MESVVRVYIFLFHPSRKNVHSESHFNLACGLGKIATHELSSKIKRFDCCCRSNQREQKLRRKFGQLSYKYPLMFELSIKLFYILNFGSTLFRSIFRAFIIFVTFIFIRYNYNISLSKVLSQIIHQTSHK